MQKIGLFGGTFNPLHTGHINSILEVKSKLELDKVKVIPANQNPLRSLIEGPDAQQRLAMVQQGISGVNEQNIEVDDVEIKRGGPSFFIETINQYENEMQNNEYFLIIGMDQFEDFHRWKNFEEILQKCQLVVTSRPGVEFPDHLPDELLSNIDVQDHDEILLKSGKKITLVQLDDVDISSSQIRKMIRKGESVTGFLPDEVQKIIEENNYYSIQGNKVADYGEFVQFCSKLLDDKRAAQIRAFDLSEVSAPAEKTIIASGTSQRHTSALADYLIKATKDQYGLRPFNIEGAQEGRWVVLDYGVVIVHLFYDYVRMQYSLEDLWKEGTEIQLK